MDEDDTEFAKVKLGKISKLKTALVREKSRMGSVMLLNIASLIFLLFNNVLATTVGAQQGNFLDLKANCSKKKNPGV